MPAEKSASKSLKTPDLRQLHKNIGGKSKGLSGMGMGGHQKIDKK